MANSLINEVTRYLRSPGCALSPAERLVLMLIADRAHEQTREAWSGGTAGWDLQEMSGLGPRGLRVALERLVRRGLEARVPRGKDGRGWPLYAHRGAQTTYRLPELDEKGGTQVPPLKGGTQVPPFEKGGTQVPEGGTQVPEGGTQVPQRRHSGSPLSLSPSGPSESLTDNGASPRPAPPRGEPVEQQPDEVLSVEDAKAQIAKLLNGRRRADTSHWKVGTAPVGEPNSLYDPAAVAAALTLNSSTEEETAR